MVDITNSIFNDDEAAREHLEKVRWSDGAFCPFCGQLDTVKALPPESMMSKPSKKNPESKPTSGWYHCRECRKKFTVCTGTVMERSHVPLRKWMLAFRLMAASKKGMSAHQLGRMLGLSYKSAWFVAHRIREAMAPSEGRSGPIGGEGQVLESDETFVGGKKKNVHKGKPEPKKHAVHALVERGGKVRATHIADVTAKSLRKVLDKHADKASTLNTDESLANLWIGDEFADHRAVVHAYGEYVSKDGQAHIQSAESFFALLKRGVYGQFHAVSEQHLQRYVNEAAFKWNNRIALGVDDASRTTNAIKGIEGKRLLYRTTNIEQTQV
jgi:transposase-like protein